MAFDRNKYQRDYYRKTVGLKRTAIDDNQVRALYLDGNSTRWIAGAMGVSQVPVIQRLKRMGVSLRPRGGPNNKNNMSEENPSFNPDCPACVAKTLHAEEDWLKHPLNRHGYSPESGWTHPDLKKEKA